MSSLFTKSSLCSVKLGPKNETLNVPFYMQWVPGYVAAVILDSKDPWYNGMNTINTIMAVPHIKSDKTKFEAEMTPNNRYYPLLRGINDVPTKGDTVLLVTIAGKNYYLGPIAIGSDANFNESSDIMKCNKTIGSIGAEETGNKVPEVLAGDISKQSLNFYRTPVRRLQKIKKLELDFKPSADEVDSTFENPIPKGATDGHVESTTHSESSHGDLIFEGRHGNSIRIGSRYVMPYMFFSNNRNKGTAVEGVNDGSLIAMISHGTLNQHFGDYTPKTLYPGSAALLRLKQPYGFLFSSDLPHWIETGTDDEGLPIYDKFNPIRSISKSVEFLHSEEWYGQSDSTYRGYGQSPPHNQPDSKKLIYGYNGNQIFLNSDRVSINAKTDSIFMSSMFDIFVGAGRHMTINTEDSLILESANIYLGHRARQAVVNEDMESQPIVLGRRLVTILSELIDRLSELHAISPTGQPVPITDALMTKITDDGVDNLGLTAIRNKLDDILSSYHFIEDNAVGDELTDKRIIVDDRDENIFI